MKNSVLIIGCEMHVDRLITANLIRQGYTCASAPSVESISEAALRLSPTLGVLDDSRIRKADALTELAKAGYGDVPIMTLSEPNDKPPFWLTHI